MMETQRLKEIINEQKTRIDQLESTLMGVKNDCNTYKRMLEQSDMGTKWRSALISQFQSIILPIKRVLIQKP